MQAIVLDFYLKITSCATKYGLLYCGAKSQQIKRGQTLRGLPSSIAVSADRLTVALLTAHAALLPALLPTLADALAGFSGIVGHIARDILFVLTLAGL
jgi:hypothetical protein